MTDPAKFEAEATSAKIAQVSLARAMDLANVPEPQQTPARYRSETFDADEGEIRITWPANLSLQSVEDMKDWLELLKRRIERRAGEIGGE